MDRLKEIKKDCHLTTINIDFSYHYLNSIYIILYFILIITSFPLVIILVILLNN